MYDEVLSASGSNPRFFESGSTIAFYLTQEARDVETWENVEYSDSDVDIYLLELNNT